MSHDELTYIFVYGTLLKGFRNAYYLEHYDSLCENAVSLDKGELLMYFDRPYVHFKIEKYPIRGALYAVDSETLAKLDELEEHPHWYRRVQKTFYSHTLEREVSAYIYEIYNVPEVPFCKSSQVGCYRTFMQDYQGENAMDWEVVDGVLVNVSQSE